MSYTDGLIEYFEDGGSPIEPQKLPLELQRDLVNLLAEGKKEKYTVTDFSTDRALMWFKEIKEDLGLTYPNLFGKTTLQTFLDIAGYKNPVNTDAKASREQAKINLDAGQRSGKKFKSPANETLFENEYIIPGVPLTWGEMTKKCTRIPTQKSEMKNILRFAKVFGVIRERFGVPILITSGFRPREINRAVGGARFSRHIVGDAGDMTPLYYSRESIDKLYSICRALDYGGLGDARGRMKFIHFDLRSEKEGSQTRFGY